MTAVFEIDQDYLDSEYNGIVADAIKARDGIFWTDDLIVKASAEITSLKSENAELSQYKQKFTEMEQAKMAAELAQKKEELISSVIKSGQITREEIEASEEMQNYVNELDKKSLMAIVGERLSASVSNETNSDVETSTVKDAHVSTNLNNEDTDAVSIMRRFLNK